jgi:hypothetical protein
MAVNPAHPPALGEVIEADTRVLEVECHALYAAPAFGTFVRAHCVGSDCFHYGVVTHVRTGPVDANRVVQAHGLPPGELEERKPHLTTLFRTTFAVHLVGYGREGLPLPGTAPQPPRLHCFVYPAEAAEIQAITVRPDFLRPLTQVQDAPLEDLLVAAMEAAGAAWGEQGHARVIAWGKYLARLLRADYVTLEGVFQRLAPAAPAPIAAPAAAPKAPRWEEAVPLVTGNGTRRRKEDPFED